MWWFWAIQHASASALMTHQMKAATNQLALIF
jgi:hypothetical protein